MRPILFSIGEVPFYSNAIFLMLGCIAGFWISSIEAARLGSQVGYSKRNMVIFFAGAIPFAYLAGWFNAWIFQSGNGTWNTAIQDFLNTGFISFGAILGTLLYAFFYARIRKLIIGEELDLAALVLPLIESIYRIGCLLNGCCYGKVTSNFFGIFLPDINGNWAYRYPIQIYLVLLNLLLFVVLWQRRRKKPYSGSQTHLYLAVYCIGRIVIDGLRGDVHGFQSLNYHQAAAAIIFTGTVMHFLIARFLPSRKAEI